jgi:hypothetical protein
MDTDSGKIIAQAGFWIAVVGLLVIFYIKKRRQYKNSIKNKDEDQP